MSEIFLAFVRARAVQIRVKHKARLPSPNPYETEIKRRICTEKSS